jgi:hypothetical protein
VTAIDRPAELRTGTCIDLGELVASLSHLMVSPGDLQGQSSATPVEQSGTVVPYTVPVLLDANHVVVVQKSPLEPTIVACGEVGGALNPDGTLAIGMLSANDSGLSGIAYFTPNPGFDNTLITILLVSDVGAAPQPISEAVEAETTEIS